ncbi:MAG: hypothetical protein FD153_1217 [Rhodospirillaceae bacterium]|nr:MAG: hypothetical protein FD153_1217 [Rhodospirillaceae bacterium]
MKTGTKEILFGIPVMIAACLTTATVQAAEPLKIIISGNMQERFSIVKHEKDAGRNFNTFGINTDDEIAFSGTTTLDNGLEVTARMVLDVYNDDLGPGDNSSPGVDEAWVSLGGALGKIYAGAKELINNSLHNQPDDYGIGYDNVDLWTRIPGAGFSVLNDVLLKQTSFEKLLDDAPMVGYASPQLAGFQLGLTYSLNPGVLGTSNNTKNTDNDHWDVTLACAREFGGVSIGVNGGYAHQDLTADNDDTLKAWNGGFRIKYAGFTVGGSYLALQFPGTHSLDGHAWNTRIAYASGPWGVNYTYFQELRRGDHGDGDWSEKFQTHLVSGKYSLRPSVDLKASLFHGKFNGQDRSIDDQNTWAYGLVSGLDVSF